MGYWSQRVFDGGLNTDNLLSEGTLSWMEDAMLDKRGRLVKRSGHRKIGDTFADGNTSGINAFLPYTSLTALQGGHLISKTGSPTQFLTRKHSSSTWISLPTAFIWDNKTVALTSHNMSSGGTFASWAHTGEEIVFTGGFTLMRWGGSTITSNYTTGTVSGTAGNEYVTGSGTSWSASTNAIPGSYFIPPTGDEVYRIVSVASTTELILDRPLQTTISGGSSYYITAFAPVTVSGVAGWSHSSLQNAIYLGSPAVNIPRPAMHQNRLFVAAPIEDDTAGSGSTVSKTYGSRIRWSALPTEVQSGASSHVGIDYWEANAYIDVAPGIGGPIQALVSLDNELLIIKTSAIFSLRGTVATDGTDLGAEVVLVSDTIGASYHNGACATPLGVVITNETGAWVYRNGSLRSLTEGRVETLWKDYAFYVNVSWIGDRIVFVDGSASYDLVYDMKRDVFFLFTMEEYHGPFVSTYSTAGLLEGHVSVQSDRCLDWSQDHLQGALNNDSGSTTCPCFLITTQPVSLNGKSPFRGRVNNVFLDAYMLRSGSESPSLDLSIYHYRSGSETATSVSDVLTYGSYDVVKRIPVDGTRASSSARISVSEDSANDSAMKVELYGLGVEFEESSVVDG